MTVSPQVVRENMFMDEKWHFVRHLDVVIQYNKNGALLRSEYSNTKLGIVKGGRPRKDILHIKECI